MIQSDLPWVSVSVTIKASVVVVVVEVSAVVITSIGFRLCQGSGGESENYDLKKDIDILKSKVENLAGSSLKWRQRKIFFS